MMDSLPSDVATINDIQSYFRQAMTEEGVEPDTVKAKVWEQGPATGATTNILIRIEKHVNGETRQHQTNLSITPANMDDIGYLRQQLATLARKAAHEYEDIMIDTIRVCGTEIDFCAAEGGWVECQRCKTQISLSSVLKQEPVFAESAELSNPMPNPYDIQSFLRKLDSDDRELLKLYLLGALRKHCKCRFGRRNMYRV